MSIQLLRRDLWCSRGTNRPCRRQGQCNIIPAFGGGLHDGRPAHQLDPCGCRPVGRGQPGVIDGLPAGVGDAILQTEGTLRGGRRGEMDADKHHAGLFLRRQRGHGRVQIGDRLIDLPLPDLRVEDAAREGLEFACDQIEQLAEIGGVKGLRSALLRRRRKGIGCQVLHQTLLVFRIGDALISAYADR